MAIPIRTTTSIAGSDTPPEQGVSSLSVSTSSTSSGFDLANEAHVYHTLPPEPDARGSVEYKLFLDPSPRREQRLVTQLLWRLGQMLPQPIPIPSSSVNSQSASQSAAQVATYMLGVLDNGACVGVDPARMSASLECLDRMASSLRSHSDSALDGPSHGSFAPIGGGTDLRIVRAVAVRTDHIPRWVHPGDQAGSLGGQPDEHGQEYEDQGCIQALSLDQVRTLLPHVPPRISTTDLQSALWSDLGRAKPGRTSTRTVPNLDTMRAVVEAQQQRPTDSMCTKGTTFDSSERDLDPTLAVDIPDTTEETRPKLNKKRQAARARRLRRKIDMIRHEREGMGIFDHSELEAALGGATSLRNSPLLRDDDLDAFGPLEGDSAFNLAISVDIEEGFLNPALAPDAYKTQAQPKRPVVVSNTPPSDEEDDPGFAFSFDLEDPPVDHRVDHLQGLQGFQGQDTPRASSPVSPVGVGSSGLDEDDDDGSAWIPREDNCRIILEVQVVRWLMMSDSFST